MKVLLCRSLSNKQLRASWRYVIFQQQRQCCSVPVVRQQQTFYSKFCFGKLQQSQLFFRIYVITFYLTWYCVGKTKTVAMKMAKKNKVRNGLTWVSKDRSKCASDENDVQSFQDCCRPDQFIALCHLNDAYVVIRCVKLLFYLCLLNF